MSRRKRNRSSQPKPAARSVADLSPRYAQVGLALVLLTTFLVYLPSMWGGVLWDDDGHITKPALRSLDGLRRIWFELGATQQYYPLLHSAFWFEHKLWGDSTLGYHLINVLWHLVAVTLVYSILKKLRIPGALLAAAIFALHPVMVESVAWISEQKNTLSAVFYLSAMLIYLNFAESRKRSSYFLALALFALGLLTKTVTATLPAALLVIFWWQRGKLSWRRDILPTVPFFALGAAGGLITAWVERTLIGAQGADFQLTFIARTLLAGRVIWFYLRQLLWPANLIFIYPRWTIDPSQWWQWLFPIAAVTLTIVLVALHKRWRAPLAGWLLFCGTLFPVLGFLNVYPFIYSFVADHFQYLASLGVIVLVSAGITLGLARLTLPARLVGYLACIALLGTLAVLTAYQSSIYADRITLYETTIARNPDCWMAHHNLGLALADADEPAAIEQYRIAIRLKPDLVDAHSSLGYLLTRAGKQSEAIKELNLALELKPDYPDALVNLGIALVNEGRYPEAIKHFERAVTLSPDYALGHNNYGTALSRVGKPQQAIDEYRRATELDPYYADAYNNWGVLLAEAGDSQEAIAKFERAIEVRPEFSRAHYNLAEALRKSGQPEPAIEHYQAALHFNPTFLQAYADLAQAFNLAHRSTDAVATAEHAIKVARASGETQAAEQFEEWLKHYRIELQRGTTDPSSSGPSPTQ